MFLGTEKMYVRKLPSSIELMPQQINEKPISTGVLSNLELNQNIYVLKIPMQIKIKNKIKTDK